VDEWDEGTTVGFEDGENSEVEEVDRMEDMFADRLDIVAVGLEKDDMGYLLDFL